MNCSRDPSDSDKDSEFNSEEEDVEFRLYEQLYFEPNPDIADNTVQSTSPVEEDGMGKAPDIDREQFVQTGSASAGGDKNMVEMRSLAPPVVSVTNDSKVYDNQNLQFEKYIFIDTLDGPEHPLTELTSDFNVQDAQTEPSVQQKELQTSNAHKVSFQDDASPLNRIALPSQTVRQRLTSTCSDGSIPGSIPLDALYCNLVSSGEGEAENDIIQEKLFMKNIKVNDHGKNRGTIIAEPSKRKRTESSSSEIEDSRCNNLISVASKNSSKKSEGCHVDEDSHSDEDIYVLPPPPTVNHEVLTLESSSDCEPEVLIKDVIRVTKQNNKYQRVEKTAISLPTQQSRVGRIFKTKDIEVLDSETDSNDVDFPEASQGTDLTLNIDRSLSGLVKTITNCPKVKNTNLPQISKAKRSPQKLLGKSTRSSVDFTKGRPDTNTKPSCEKWTQSMANFYDSDVSDDLDVSAVHQHQSGSAGDWHLVPADYQITQRRRYYNAPERCKQCRQEGHTSKTCPRVPKCHLCSATDHSGRHNCPNNCCFKCGEEPHYFCPNTDRRRICALCGYPGHSKDLCPDLWRRFHLTTLGLVAQTPLEDCTKPPRERCCNVCGKRGHFGHDCPLKYNNVLYAQVPQSVVSYSSPVNLINGSFAVNIEGAHAPVLEKDVTKMIIRMDDTGRIIGKKGVVVKAINKETGAHIRVISEGQPQVLILGPSEARHKAQEIIQALLGHKKKSEKYAVFVEHLRAINTTNTTPSITINENVPSVSAISKITAETATTSGTTATVGVSERNWNVPWCEDFLFSLDRRKECVLKKVKKIMGTFTDNGSKIKLSCALRYLERFSKKRKSDPSLVPTEALKRHMKKVALIVIGKGRFGEGDKIYSEMKTLLEEVEKHPGKTTPEDICVKIAKTLECLHEPPLYRLEELIQYGNLFTQVFLKQRAQHQKAVKGCENKKKTLNKVKLKKNPKNAETKMSSQLMKGNVNDNNENAQKKKKKFKKKKAKTMQNGNAENQKKKNNPEVKKKKNNPEVKKKKNNPEVKKKKNNPEVKKKKNNPEVNKKKNNPEVKKKKNNPEVKKQSKANVQPSTAKKSNAKVRKQSKTKNVHPSHAKVRKQNQTKNNHPEST